MRAGESFTGAPDPLTLLTTTAATPIILVGGKYWLSAVGNWNSGSATLQRFGPDGTTLVTVATQLTANGGNVSELPPGKYQVTIAGTTTAIWWELVRVNEE